MDSLVDSESGAERHRETKATTPGGRGAKGVFRGEMHVEKPSPSTLPGAFPPRWRTGATCIQLCYSGFQNLGFHTRAIKRRAKLQALLKGCREGLRGRGTVTHYAVIWGHVADAADRVRLNRSNS